VLGARAVLAAASVAAAFLAPAAASADASFERPWPTRSCVVQEPCGALYCKTEMPAAAGCQARADALGFTLLRTIEAADTICAFEILIPAQFDCADNPPLAE